MLADLKPRVIREAFPVVVARVRTGSPEYVFRFDGGIGDEFLCTILARELKKREARNIWMLTDYPDLFCGNPDFSFVTKKGLRGVRRFFEVSHTVETRVSYAAHVGGRDIPPNKHIITTMCERVGISGPIARRPYLHLSDSEHAQGFFGARQIALQTSARAAKYAALTKEWFPTRFQEIVRALGPRYTIVQVGATGDPLMEGVIDMRGKTTIRQTAAILANSLVFVGLAGFLQHLARGVDCRAVIIYGGRELPYQTGYTCQANIVNQPACSPCWIYGMCEHNVKCMEHVSTEQVLDAVETQLRLAGVPLVEDCETIGVDGENKIVA